ncbi:MAG TPA: sigma-54 dependent transcriptional regulator, partial [Polyangiaceae bacterium]|nr:sigma-54 dependent transcriptional regulator [Polyangiaceae bacterium]
LTKPTTLRCGDTRLEFEPNRPERVPLAKSDRFGLLVGGSLAMRALFEQLRSIAPTTLSVLIHGETGTGKELVAQAIHGASRRAGGPLVVIDCAAIPTQLVESKLFGHEKGAFTGALSKHISPFVEASGGTVFLDEIGELPLDVQPKLLRALAAQRVQSVGSNSYVPIDVRVVAATHRDLPQDINRGTFRSDLFFRVAEARVEVPALRDRKEDIPALVAHLLTEAGEEKAIRRIDPLSLDRLMQHDWPGNVRELRSAVKRALAFDKGGPLDVAAGLVPSIEGGPAGGGRASSAIDGQTHAQWMNEHDRTYFAALFRESAGNISEMSRRSGLDRATVRSRVQKHRLGTALPHGR